MLGKCLIKKSKPIPAEPKEYYPPTGVTSPGHWRDSTPTGDCGGNSPLGAHQSDCHNPRKGRPPKLALGTKGQAGPSCTNEVTPESSPALRMDTPQILRQTLEKSSFVTVITFSGEFCHNLFIQSKPIPAEPKEYYPPTGVTSPSHWRDSTPTGDCGGNSPLGAHQSDCHNPRKKSSSDSGPNSYLPPLV
uniref:Uncharacterized protein n=1 Tax=Magallana gigas TaxID=29159 RepID=A0A8W8P648_MAGGI